MLSGRTMGTGWQLRLAGALPRPLPEIRRAVEAELARVVAQMSHWEPDSDLCRFNRAPPGAWQALPSDFATVLGRALALAADSGGAFDPAAGALVDLWGFGPPGPRDGPPAPEAIASWPGQAWRQIELDAATGRARRHAEVRLDLSAIAKGYAVDLVAERIESLGIGSYLVEVGGELRGLGVKPDGQPWWVALEPTPGRRAGAATVIALHGLAVATSGDYRRGFDAGGRHYSHLLDPRTGQPIDSGLSAVSVLHPRCLEADALATLLAVLGPRDGIAHATRRGIAALFVAGDGTEAMTPAFAAMLDEG